MFPLIYLEEATSTNEEILKFLSEEPEGLSLYTFHQTNGKGQYGNRWESPKGQSLAYSIALDTKKTNLSANLFNYHTAIMVRDFIAKMTHYNPEIKWPNDIILNAKKICGMLIEKVSSESHQFYIVGIGINVLRENFEGLPKAGSIFTQTGLILDLEIFTNQFHEYISNTIGNVMADDKILTEFNHHLFRKDKISVFEMNGVRQNGIIRSADENGFLNVELESGGLKKFFHKQIELLY